MPHRFSIALLALCLLIPAAATAQDAVQDAAQRTAFQYLANNWNRHGLTLADVRELVVTDQTTSSRSGITHVYLHQAVDGIPVVTGQMTINVDRHGRVIHGAGQLEPGLALRLRRGTVGISAEQAVRALADDAGLQTTNLTRTTSATSKAGHVEMSDGGIARLPINARLVYADDGTGAIRLAWETTLYLKGVAHDWFGRIDAASGRVLLRSDVLDHDTFGPRVMHDEASFAPFAETQSEQIVRTILPTATMGGAVYRVYAAPDESPQHGLMARSLMSGAEDGDASPLGWHDTDGTLGPEFTIAQGNNVHAYADRDDNDSPSAGEDTDGGAGLSFDFPIDYANAPSTYKDAAVTNLFYWNNVFHDILHGFGFDEASGNFQFNTYGNGGVGNDPVQAEAQDGGDTCNDPQNPTCTNNANFSTPADGGPGRMQMYEWTSATPRLDGDLDAGIIVHEYGHGVSNRLTGGPSATSCLRNGEQMGEGWSDWLGLIMTQQAAHSRNTPRGIGTYALNQPVAGAGIRPARYSTNFAVNDYTYQRTRSGLSVPHGVGFVWATVLWEATWDLIDAHGFSSDLYDEDGAAGNQIMFNLVLEGMKLQPCSPGFIDGRDAILAADEALYNGDHVDLLWEAFARRGLGLGASQGSTDTNSDNTESFVVPEEIAPDAVTDLAAVPNGDFVTLTFTATGDDGTTGTAAVYTVRRSLSPILTEQDFNAATPVAITAVPLESGTAEQIEVGGLDFNESYHFALVVTDDSYNDSELSNSASATTLSAPSATIPTDAIDVATNGVETASFTVSNAGPSDLRMAVTIEETTSGRVAAPMAQALVREEVASVKGEAETPGVAQRLDGGGPDSFGYRWADSNEPGGPTYNWIDISSTGTAVSLGDDDTETVPLPFDFPYYGVAQNAVRIVSNGFLAFGGTSTDFSNDPIPSSGQPNAFLAAYWDDLDPPEGGEIRYQDMGDGRFVVSYLGVKHYVSGGGRGSFTFQVVLNQSGAIVYQYQEMAPDAADATSATIGIENLDGTDGLQVVYNAPYIEDNLAIRISALWVEADITSASVGSGASQDVVLTFDAGGLAPGVYSANLTVLSNDPSNPATVIPLSLTVGTVATEDASDGFEGTHELSAAYPNPASAAARINLQVAEAQAVRVDVYDALGRQVSTAFEGELAGRAATTITIPTEGLATGTYVIRITGSAFADTRRLTISR